MLSFAQQSARNNWNMHGGESKIKSRHHVDAETEHLCSWSAPKDLQLSGTASRAAKYNRGKARSILEQECTNR